MFCKEINAFKRKILQHLNGLIIENDEFPHIKDSQGSILNVSKFLYKTMYKD